MLLTYKLNPRESTAEEFDRDVAGLASLTGEPHWQVAEQYGRGNVLHAAG